MVWAYFHFHLTYRFSNTRDVVRLRKYLADTFNSPVKNQSFTTLQWLGEQDRNSAVRSWAIDKFLIVPDSWTGYTTGFET